MNELKWRLVSGVYVSDATNITIAAYPNRPGWFTVSAPNTGSNSFDRLSKAKAYAEMRLRKEPERFQGVQS